MSYLNAEKYKKKKTLPLILHQNALISFLFPRKSSYYIYLKERERGLIF